MVKFDVYKYILQVLFLWVTNSQKQFEWLTEILRQVEDQDKRGLIRNHIFITQFKNEFDMRTIFLVSHHEIFFIFFYFVYNRNLTCLKIIFFLALILVHGWASLPKGVWEFSVHRTEGNHTFLQTKVPSHLQGSQAAV